MGVFRMPSLGADMEAGTLTEWLVKPGDTVRRGDIVAVVETQKGAIEIEVFEEGRVHSLTAEVGQQLPVGAALAVILAEGEAQPAGAAEGPRPEAAPKPPAPAPEPPRALASVEVPPVEVPPIRTPRVEVPRPGGIVASPAARKRAAERGVDLAAVAGSGPGGAIVLADVDRPGSAPPRTEAPRAPFDEMRKAIAAAMTRSKQTIPHFYVSETIDLQPAIDWLARHNADAPPAERLLVGALFVRAAVVSAARVPTTNGQFSDGLFHPADGVNAGVAIALRGGGLVAPALIGADGLSLAETMAGMRDLVSRARAGRLRGSEMTSGTITISSLGDGGAEAMVGVIFPPQVALVGIGSPRTRPWVVDGEAVPRTVVSVSLSVDHRVCDGRQASAFLDAFRTFIAQPESL
ncbi:dihydrolipoamide acetyltransferase family protein [Palleronia sp. KMU-117]|uniref:dihydrolipoamide acetyltransferase family protein n=1 Tax=Palleronia sp. KMU-117 TaxID=3434108 RepID=UPI003D74DE96